MCLRRPAGLWANTDLEWVRRRLAFPESADALLEIRRIASIDTAYLLGEPKLSICGQWLHFLSKKGLVTPSNSPACGCRALMSVALSTSWIVKNGRKSPVRGIYVQVEHSWNSSSEPVGVTYRSQKVAEPPNDLTGHCRRRPEY